jgi:hypothetical protein
MAENDPKVKVVKIKPYPIPCTLKKGEAGAPIKCEIVRLEVSGFIFKTSNIYFKTGDEYQSEFELPVLNNKIVEKIRIMKTYEVATGRPGRPITVEAHFRDPVPKCEDVIRQFNLKIGQKSS